MPLLTILARVTDGLVLAESMESSSSAGDIDSQLDVYRSQAKQIFRSLTTQSPSRMSIDAEGFFFLYLIENSICYLTLCESSYPKQKAYQFLMDIQAEFDSLHGSQVLGARRPYHFIHFDTNIQKIKKKYDHQQTHAGNAGIDRVNEDLRDIQNIMHRNIQDILTRGEKIEAVTQKSENLVCETSKYHKKANAFNSQLFWRQYGPLFIGIVIIFLVFVLRTLLF